MINKNSIFLLGAILISTSSLADTHESRFIPSDLRSELIESLPLSLGILFNDSAVQACWENRNSPDGDKALISLYLLAEGKHIIDETALEHSKILESDLSEYEKYIKLKDAANRDIDKLERLITPMPKAMKYCNSLISEADSPNYQGAENNE